MKVLAFLVCCLLSPLSMAAVINHVDSDWATYDVTMIADADYTVFGGGSAGDVFHMQFDFNNAYLPYITDVNSEWQSTELNLFLTGTALDTATAAVDDYVQIDELALGDTLRFQINGLDFISAAPYYVTLAGGAITGISSGLYASGPDGLNGIFGSSFTLTDGYYSSNLYGHQGDIVDLKPNVDPVSVPEPGLLVLLLTGLTGMAFQRRRYRS